jgi:hypothetical protein
MMAAGAEAETSTILSQAEDEGWIKAELYCPVSIQLRLFTFSQIQAATPASDHAAEYERDAAGSPSSRKDSSRRLW